MVKFPPLRSYQTQTYGFIINLKVLWEVCTMKSVLKIAAIVKQVIYNNVCAEQHIQYFHGHSAAERACSPVLSY